MSLIANTPKPPYYAVIFSSLRNDDIEGYAETAARMVELASLQPGFLGLNRRAKIWVSRFLTGPISSRLKNGRLTQNTSRRKKWVWINGIRTI